MLAMLFQHWLLLVSCWTYPDRRSDRTSRVSIKSDLVKGAGTVRSYVVMLAGAMAGVVPMTAVLEIPSRTLSYGCRMNSRRRKPNTYQLLLGDASGA